jgi:hypothetical protein
MLSEYERRELALIEQGLAEDDRKLAESFRPRRLPSARRRDRRWMSRSLLGFGVLLLVVGVLTGTYGLFLQGLLFGGPAVAWMRWQRRRPATTDPEIQRQARRSRPNGGPAQGWSRPV